MATIPDFEVNQFDKDGNWIDGPLHPKNRDKIKDEELLELLAAHDEVRGMETVIPETREEKRARLEAELAALDDEEYEEEEEDDSDSSNDELDFDPGDFTVEEVLQYVNEHPDEREAVIAAEKARGSKSRSTLVAALTE